MEVGWVFEDSTSNTSSVGAGTEETKASRSILNGWIAREPVRISSNTDLSTAIQFSQHGPAFKMNFISLTIVPLLKSEPLAQNELVIRSRGVTVLVSRFHNAPQAE